MDNQPPRDIDWPTRRWLLWGLLAIAVLAIIVLFFIWFGNQTSADEDGSGSGPGPQVEWSISLDDMSGQTVTLKADEPEGVTTETWVDDLMLERGAADRWEWDMVAELPGPVVEIDGTSDCVALTDILEEWLEGVAAAEGEVYNWQSRAFVQHTVNAMRSTGCDIEEALLGRIAGG